VKAARVTEAMKGPRYRRNVCNPVPNPTDERMPNPTQYRHHSVDASKLNRYWREGIQKKLP